MARTPNIFMRLRYLTGLRGVGRKNRLSTIRDDCSARLGYMDLKDGLTQSHDFSLDRRRLFCHNSRLQGIDIMVSASRLN
jgi:hypothetical protein